MERQGSTDGDNGQSSIQPAPAHLGISSPLLIRAIQPLCNRLLYRTN
jgi:hypothetical protein